MIQVSIIVPMYNVAHYLDECVNSLLKQEINKEIILIDDGSTDETYAIAEKYSQTYDFISLYHQTNSGQSSARNFGLKKAKGEYVFFCDSDDYIDNNSLDFLYKICKQNDLAFIRTGWKTHWTDGVVQNNVPPNSISIINKCVDAKKFFLESISSWYNVGPCNGIYCTSWLRNYGCTFPEGIQFEDNTFTLQVCLIDTKAKVMLINYPFYHVRIRENSTTTEKVKPKKIYDILKNVELMNEFINSSIIDIDLQREAKRAVSSLIFTMTSYYYRVEKNYRKELIKVIPRKYLREAILYPQTKFQKMKVFVFMFCLPLLDIYEYFHMKKMGR